MTISASTERTLPQSGPTSRLTGDLIWTLLSFGLGGAFWIGINAWVAAIHGARSMGLFSLGVALQLLVGQVAAFGVQLSIVAQLPALPAEERPACLTGALAGAAVMALATALVTGLCGPWVLEAVGRADLVHLVLWLSPGFFFFGVNKALLGALNGLQLMRAHAVGQLGRFVFLFAFLVALWLAELPGSWCVLALSASEAVLFPFLVLLLWKRGIRPAFGLSRAWLARHLGFGGKALLGGFVFEVNSRLDVLMVGWFCQLELVGAYGFAATLAEGALQLPGVLRVNLSPRLSALLAAGNAAAIRVFLRSWLSRGYLVFSPVFLALILMFPLVLMVTGQGEAMREGWLPFGIIMGGAVLTAGFQPLAHVLLCCGLPGYHTLVALVATGCNFAFNLIFIPRLGLAGAALATAAALGVHAVLVRRISKTKGSLPW